MERISSVTDGMNPALAVRLVARFSSKTMPSVRRFGAERVQTIMQKLRYFILFGLVGITAASAEGVEWRSFAFSNTGLRVDVPVSIFTDEGPPPEGAQGRTLFTADRRADLTIKSVPNPQNDSPEIFLKRMRPPAGIQYKRVTSDFLPFPAFAAGELGTIAAIVGMAS